MKRENWKYWFEGIGVLAIVASLIFLALQVRQEQNIAESQAYMESASTVIELTQLLNENLDVWVNGLEGVELTPLEAAKFESLHWAVFQRKVAVWQRRVLLDAGDPDSWVETYAFEIYTYRGLRRAYEKMNSNLNLRRGYFDRTGSGGSFTLQVREALKKLDQLAPPVPADKSYVLR